MSDQARAKGVRTGWTPAGCLFAAIALCGCQSTAPSTRQTRAEPIPAGKTEDTTPVAAAGNSAANSSAGASATKASDAAGPANTSPAPAVQANSAPSAGSRWSNLFGHNQTPDRVVLPRNDQDAENGPADAASEKTAANDF